MDKKYIYESPDKGKTVYRREMNKTERELYYTEYDQYKEIKGTWYKSYVLEWSNGLLEECLRFI